MKNKKMMTLVLAAAFVSVGLTCSAAQDGAKPEKAIQAQGAKNADVKKGDSQEAVVTTAATQETQPVKEKKDKPAKPKKLTGEQHRSAVASFVQSLLAVADREGGIGQQVRTIAQQQNDMKDQESNIINAVESRSKIKTFLIGTSYKNLGELRSQMVETRNQIDQLKRLAEQAQNEQDKTELQTQIQSLETQQTSINNFITENENKFSLFGWAVKLFRK